MVAKDGVALEHGESFTTGIRNGGMGNMSFRVHNLDGEGTGCRSGSGKSSNGKYLENHGEIECRG